MRCRLRVFNVIGICVAAAFAHVIWYEIVDVIRRIGYFQLPADATGPDLVLNSDSVSVLLVLGVLFALALDALTQ